jgi:dUTP pyrophosphatase
MKVKFKKLTGNAVAPYRGTDGSAGFDLTATSKQRIDLYHTKFGTGLAVEIPKGYVGLVFPRSSCYKQGMLLSNCVGVIDSDYRGEITAVFIGVDNELCYNVGDRICQLVIMPYPEIEFVEADELSETERGMGGYGSTGK